MVETIADKVKKEAKIIGRRRSDGEAANCLGQNVTCRRSIITIDQGRPNRLGKLLDEGGTQHIAWRVVAAEFVTTDSGTGVVHQAPAFGEVDYDVLLAEQARFVDGQGPPLICSVGPDGKFTDETPGYQGPLGQGGRS